jgi:glycosyltransferase involved in cell wall biosynthesis
LNIRYTKEAVEIIIATMNRDSLDFLIPMFPFAHFADFSILIVNQTHKDAVLTTDFPTVKVINSFEIGLSKSRNLGLKNSQGEILILADDDEVFQPDFIETIVAAYELFPDAAVISFQIENENRKLFKKYPKKSQMFLKPLTLFSVMSIEITINKAILDASGIEFDTHFGLGATFEMGEEAIFLMDLYRQEQQISFVPKVIASHTDKTTTDKVSFLQRYYIQGAFLKRVGINNWIFRVLQKVFYDVKQKKIRLKETPKAIQFAFNGRKKYLEITQ